MQLCLGKLYQYGLAVGRYLQWRVGKCITLHLCHQIRIVIMLEHANLISLASLMIHVWLGETRVYETKQMLASSKSWGHFRWSLTYTQNTNCIYMHHCYATGYRISVCCWDARIYSHNSLCPEVVYITDSS